MNRNQFHFVSLSMWMKIVGCLFLVIVLNCGNSSCGNVNPHSVYRVEQPLTDIKISKNVTIHRNGYGRLLRLLALLKGLHHRKHDVYSPYIISRLWRASFEFEVKPHPVFENEITSGTYFPTNQFVVGQNGVGSHGGGGAANNGLGSNSIDSIFHFGNNEQQSSVTIGGSNQIVKGPDERDEIPVEEHVINKDAIDPVISVPTTEVAENSERVQRHAIQPRTDEQSDDDESVDSTTSNTPNNIDDNEKTTISSVTAPTTDPSLATPQTEGTSTFTEAATTMTPEREASTETATTMTPDSSSTNSNKNHQVSSTTLPSEWMGYYDVGIHKPEFIQGIEFTTNYPSQFVGEDIQYVTYDAPFKPSLPDYSRDSSNFFVPLLQRYFRR